MSEARARAVVQADSSFDEAESATRLSRSPAVVLAELRRALDALVALDPAVLADGDAIVALSAEVARLESVVCRQSAAFDRSTQWSADGARNPSAWITMACRVERKTARRRVWLGEALWSMPLADHAFAVGTIGVDQLTVLVGARERSQVIADAYVRDEAMLVAWAKSLVFHQFRREVDEWIQGVDEAGEEDRAQRMRDGRRLHMSQSFENKWFADVVLDPVGGEIVNNALRSITAELFDQEWAAAKNRLGFSPGVMDLDRTPQQRRADALVEMAIRAQTAPAGGRRPAPLFTVLLGVEAFRRTLELADSNTIIPPGSAARWLDDAVFERIVFDGPDRVLAVSRQRSFRGAVRRAIQVRDRRCAHPYCDRPVSECAVDHIVEYASGGCTSQENGRLYCAFHNELRNYQRPADRKTDPVFA